MSRGWVGAAMGRLVNGTQSYAPVFQPAPSGAAGLDFLCPPMKQPDLVLSHPTGPGDTWLVGMPKPGVSLLWDV